MKIFKRIALVLLSVIVLLLIIAAFIDGKYAIEKSVIIQQPQSVVYEYVKYVKNQDNFSVWNQRDPNMKKSYRGTDGEIGFIYAWESKDEHVGTGEQEIIGLVPNDSVKFQLRFKIPFETQDNAYLCVHAIDSTQSEVKWGFQGEFPYPFTLMKVALSMEDAVGKDLGKGLENLKKVLEKK